MKIAYKIEGDPVERDTFNSLVHDMVLFNVWEQVLSDNSTEIEKNNFAVTFKIVNGKMHVLTDTQLLFKLNYLVNQELFNVLSLQSVLIYR